MTIFDTVPEVNPNLVWATARTDLATTETLPQRRGFKKAIWATAEGDLATTEDSNP